MTYTCESSTSSEFHLSHAAVPADTACKLHSDCECRLRDAPLPAAKFGASGPATERSEKEEAGDRVRHQCIIEFDWPIQSFTTT